MGFFFFLIIGFPIFVLTAKSKEYLPSWGALMISSRKALKLERTLEDEK